MNSRTRMNLSLNHREPDRVPVDLGSTPSSGISAIAYNNLTRYLATKNNRNLIYDVVQQLAQPEDAILDQFKIDVIDIGRAFNADANDWHEVMLPDGSMGLYPIWFQPIQQMDGSLHAYSRAGDDIGKMIKGATFFDQTLFPYIDGYPAHYKQLEDDMGKVIWAALAHSPWDHVLDSNFWQRLRERALYLKRTTDRALVIVCGCNLFEWGTFLRRIDNFLIDLYTETKQAERLLDALMEIHLATLSKVCAAVGDVADVIRFGDDLGMESGPFFSPDIYRRIFKPRQKILCDFVKRNSSMKTFLHSCGSVYRLLPDIIEAGYDILNPVQTTAHEMNAVKLKKEFGKDLVFWGGGSDTRNMLNRGTIREIKDDVKRRLEIFAPGGGYVFNPIHNILPDVPPQNIVAMFEAVDEFFGC
jgi:uroporphyrinogen decarboxylase